MVVKKRLLNEDRGKRKVRRGATKTGQYKPVRSLVTEQAMRSETSASAKSSSTHEHDVTEAAEEEGDVEEADWCEGGKK